MDRPRVYQTIERDRQQLAMPSWKNVELTVGFEDLETAGSTVVNSAILSESYVSLILCLIRGRFKNLSVSMLVQCICLLPVPRYLTYVHSPCSTEK